jgi:hypothetical protein
LTSKLPNKSASLEVSVQKGGVRELYKKRALRAAGGLLHVPREGATEAIAAGYKPEALGTTERVVKEGSRSADKMLQIEAVVTTLVAEDQDAVTLLKGELPSGVSPNDIGTYEPRPLWRRGESGAPPGVKFPFPCLALALPERGFKYRVASLSPKELVTKTQSLNRVLLRLLKHDSNSNYALKGSDSIPKNLKRALSTISGEKEALSADLSTASDLLGLDVNHAVLRGVQVALAEAGMPIREKDWALLYASIKEQAIVDSRNPTPDQLKSAPRTKRGALMGLGLAWSILTIVNDWAATKAHKPDQGPHYRGNRAYGPFVLCGDDMAAYWHRDASQRYKDNLASTGLLLNDKKTFRSSTGIIFVEKLFKIDKIVEETRLLHKDPESPKVFNPSRATVWDYIKQKCRDGRGAFEVCEKYAHVRRVDRIQLSAISLAKRYAGSDSDKTPAWQALPEILQEQARKVGLEEWRIERAMEVARYLHPDAFRILKQSGMPLHWPKELGGWGLPGKPDAPIKFRKAAAIILTNAEDARDATLQQIVAVHATSSLPEIASKTALEGRLLLAEISQSSRRDFTSRRDLSRLPDAQAELTAAVAAHFAWLDDDTTRKSSVGKISKRVKRIVEEVTKTWASVKPMNPGKAVEMLKNIDTPLYCPSQIITEVLKGLAIPQDTVRLVYQAALARSHSDQTEQEARSILRFPWDRHFQPDDDRYHIPLGIPMNPFAGLASVGSPSSRIDRVRDAGVASIEQMLAAASIESSGESDSELTKRQRSTVSTVSARPSSGPLRNSSTNVRTREP